MLMPESGASMVMNVATSRPANTPVNRAAFAWLDAVSTTVMRTQEITASATKATAAPPMPGRVTAKCTGSSPSMSRTSTLATRTPSTAPTNWAAM